MLGRTTTLWAIGALALLGAPLGGCSSPDLAGSFAFGKAPEKPPLNPTLYPDKYKTEIADFMRTYLNNPTKVKDAFIGTPVLKPVNGHPQYVTCVRYNPRDTRNQYEGPKTNTAIFLGGQLTQFLPENPELCAGLAYQRYPEIENMVP